MANILAISQKTNQSPENAPGKLHKAQSSDSEKKELKTSPCLIRVDKASTKNTLLHKKAVKKSHSKYLNMNLQRQASGSKIEQDLSKAFKCGDYVTLIDGKKTTYCCNKKNCIPCTSRRCAELINYYSEALQSMQDPQFVTLSIPNMVADQLHASVKRYDGFWKKMSKKWRDAKHKDKTCPSFDAVVVYESTNNQVRNDYHPHVHAIIDGKHIARIIKLEWLKYFPESKTGAQKIKPVTNIQDAVQELFKYITKFMEPKEKTDTRGRLVRRAGVDVKAAITILSAFKGIKTLKTYGSLRGSVGKAKEKAKLAATEAKEILYKGIENGVYKYDRFRLDWFEQTTNTPLTGYIPTQQDLEKLKLYAGNAYSEQIEKQLATPLQINEVPPLPESKPIVIPERNYIVARGQYGEILKHKNQHNEKAATI